MSETKFTPEPWYLTESETWGTKSFLVQAGPFHSIAEVRNGAEDEEYGGDERMTANAHLIAAAPELFSALEKLMEDFKKTIATEYNWTQQNEQEETWLLCKKAIAKAKGES